VRVWQEAGVAQRRPWEVEDSLRELIEPLLRPPRHRPLLRPRTMPLAGRAGHRRLRIRWEARDDIHEAFLTIGCAIIC
jgi:hypothetical protein